MQSTLNLPVIGLDLAKSVFQLHIVDVETGEIQRRQIKRAKLTEFFAKCIPSLVAMEACGSSHYWARTIRALGHEVKLLPAQPNYRSHRTTICRRGLSRAATGESMASPMMLPT